MKKIIITKPGCQELANHLLNYLSIYAYGLETGAQVVNPSFSKWYRYFNLKKDVLERLWSIFDGLYGSYVVRAHKKCALFAVNEVVHLSSTTKKNACDTLYFIGWFFRNPLGLEKYHDEILSAFQPKEHILKKIENILSPLKGKKLVGVQIRQQPYPGFSDGRFLVSPERVRQVVDEYMSERKLSAVDTALVVVSDKAVDLTMFEGFATHVSHEDEVTNLFLLSKCSVVIGTNSTSSNLAAWFGNVPHIVTTNESINWEYYHDIKTYFENKYVTFAE